MSALAKTVQAGSANLDWDAVRRDLAGLNLIESRGQRKQLSRDFYWYSPILSAQLDDCLAELVVKVSTEDDVRQVAERVRSGPGVPDLQDGRLQARQPPAIAQIGHAPSQC